MIVTRFAPSPTGYLHLGHAFAAINAHDAAKREGGRFLLRIEDIDWARCRPEFEQAIYEDLQWLGLEWDEPVLRQSERFDAYREALSRLGAAELLYPCFCTRAEIAAEIACSAEAPHGPEGPLYPGICRGLSRTEQNARMQSGLRYALRLDAQKAAECVGSVRFEERGCVPGGQRGQTVVNPCVFGDVVLARKDTPASYHLAVVADDAFQGVTLVTRGNDLFATTHVHRTLQALLELRTPVYQHHRLMLDGRGCKLSKRDRALSLREFRAQGVAPGQIHEWLGLSE